MAITSEQLIARRSKIGSSDAAAIMGLDPYRSSWDVWAEKTGKLKATADFPSEAAEIGTALESGLLKLAERRIGRPVVSGGDTFMHGSGILAANVDGMVERFERGAEIVEAKDTGVAEGWGEAGTDQIPNRVLIQVTVQMACSDSHVAHVVRLLARFGHSLEMFRVAFNPRLAVMILEECQHFWDSHVKADVPPSGVLPSMTTLKEFVRVPAKVVSIPAAIVQDWRAEDAAAKTATKRADAAKAKVLAALGDAERGESEAGNVTYYEQARESYTVAASTFRVARFTTK
jgi:putative phage-type endonuclease